VPAKVKMACLRIQQNNIQVHKRAKNTLQKEDEILKKHSISNFPWSHVP